MFPLSLVFSPFFICNFDFYLCSFLLFRRRESGRPTEVGPAALSGALPEVAAKAVPEAPVFGQGPAQSGCGQVWEFRAVLG